MKVKFTTTERAFVFGFLWKGKEYMDFPNETKYSISLVLGCLIIDFHFN